MRSREPVFSAEARIDRSGDGADEPERTADSNATNPQAFRSAPPRAFMRHLMLYLYLDGAQIQELTTRGRESVGKTVAGTANRAAVSAAPKGGRGRRRQCSGILRLPYLLVLRDPDRPLLLSGIPDLSRTGLFVGKFWGRVPDEAPRWCRHRYVRRPGRPQAGDGALLRTDGRVHPWPGTDPVLRPDRD